MALVSNPWPSCSSWSATLGVPGSSVSSGERNVRTSVRVSTDSGRPPASTSSAGTWSSISTTRDSGWPTPTVGSFGPITFSTGVSSSDGSRKAASMSASSSTAPATSAAANGGSFLHTGSCETPVSRMRAMASRTVWSGLT